MKCTMQQIILLSILGILLVGDSIVGANHRHGSRAYGGHGWRQSIHPSEHGHNDYDQYDFGQQAQNFDDVGDERDTQQTVNNEFEEFEGSIPSKHYFTPRPPITTIDPSDSITQTPTPAKYRGQNQPEATTSLGKIVGKKVRLTTGKIIYEFLGIRYAQPPTGDLRFKLPVPIGSWDVPYEATQLPNACSQESYDVFGGFSGEQRWNPNTNVSEDCLFLNIWVPEEVFNSKEEKLASVLFWIHGGGFFSGSSSLEVYNGAYLAGQEGVIVVSTQYRLGPLGFLYLGVEDAPGNVGLFDQNLALKFVHKHIASFGGDSSEVTIFGESAGSVSVSYHLLSPESKPYFKRAVMMSGVPTETIYGSVHPNILKARSIKLAKLAGCNIHQQSPQQIAACLREKDPKTLMKLQWNVTNRKMLEFAFIPTIDGKFTKDFPSNVINDGNAKRADLMIGTVQDEGSYFILYQYLNYFHHDKATSLSRDRFVEIMKDIFQDYSNLEQQAIINEYTNWENPDDGILNQERISEAVGDCYFICPNRKFADAWSNRGLKVFYYHFTQRSSSNEWSKWMGVMHGDEIEYMLAHPMNNSLKFTPGEKQLSIYMTRLLANFAKIGTPSENWDRYTSETPVYVEFNATIPSDKSTPNRYGPRAQKCQLWNKFLPQLRSQSNRHPHSHGFAGRPFRREQPLQNQYANFNHVPGSYYGNRGGIHGGQGFHWDTTPEGQCGHSHGPYSHGHSHHGHGHGQPRVVSPPIAPAASKNFGRTPGKRGNSGQSCQRCCNDQNNDAEEAEYVTPIPV